MEPTETDEAVVRRALKDKDVFGVLIERYEERLDRYMRRLGIHEREDRQDLLQDVFIKVYRNLNGFDAARSFSSWVYRIAHNETMSWYRKKRVRPEGHLIDEGDTILLRSTDDALGPDSLLQQTLNTEHLSHALNYLDQKYRDVIILRFFEHKEYEEISDILEVPTGSVATLLHRAKKKLREQLSHIEDEA